MGSQLTVRPGPVLIMLGLGLLLVSRLAPPPPERDPSSATTS